MSSTFTLTRPVLALNVAPAATPPGAAYAAPSVAATLAAGLNPSQTGTTPGIAANNLSLARHTPLLVALAQYCERPILREPREQPSAYAVDDNGRLYIHRPATAIPSSRLVATAAKAS
jgi:hypothetical protein